MAKLSGDQRGISARPAGGWRFGAEQVRDANSSARPCARRWQAPRPFQRRAGLPVARSLAIPSCGSAPACTSLGFARSPAPRHRASGRAGEGPPDATPPRTIRGSRKNAGDYGARLPALADIPRQIGVQRRPVHMSDQPVSRSRASCSDQTVRRTWTEVTEVRWLRGIGDQQVRACVQEAPGDGMLRACRGKTSRPSGCGSSAFRPSRIARAGADGRQGPPFLAGKLVLVLFGNQQTRFQVGQPGRHDQIVGGKLQPQRRPPRQPRYCSTSARIDIRARSTFCLRARVSRSSCPSNPSTSTTSAGSVLGVRRAPVPFRSSKRCPAPLPQLGSSAIVTVFREVRPPPPEASLAPRPSNGRPGATRRVPPGARLSPEPGRRNLASPMSPLQ